MSLVDACIDNHTPLPAPLPQAMRDEMRDGLVIEVLTVLNNPRVLATIKRSDDPEYGRVDLPAGNCVCCAEPCHGADFIGHRQNPICDQCTVYGCGIDSVYCQSHNTFQQQTIDAIDEKAYEISKLFGKQLAQIPEIEQMRGLVASLRSPTDHQIIRNALCRVLGIQH